MDEVSGAMRMLSAPRPADLAQGVGRFIDYELLDRSPRAQRRTDGSSG